MPYSDWDGKIILHSWGRFRIELAEACQAGDLLTMNGELADGDNKIAHFVACEKGASGDTIWAALAVEVKKPATIGSGGAVTQGNHGGEAEDILYLGGTAGGNVGKLSTATTAVVKQACGLVLSQDRVMIWPGRPAFVAAAAFIESAPAGGTGATVGAYDTEAHRDAMIATINAILLVLRNLGFVKTM